MIRFLAIRNLAVIESASVEFEQSFNVLTGETGAGKSILVGAVGLLLGGRATQDLIRTGEDLATVEAVVETADGEEVIVRREITSQGRSRAFVNGTLASAADLRILSSSLVELHGQHEHQLLLDPAHHLPLLDGWAGLNDRASRVAAAFDSVRELREQLERLRMDARERTARLDLVEFQLGELKRASVRIGEDEELGTERVILRHAETIERLCSEGYAELYDAESAVLGTLDRVWKRVGELASIDARFGAYVEAKSDIKAQLEDLAFALRDFAGSLDAAPGRLQAVEDRLSLLENLKRKFGPTLTDVVDRQDQLGKEHARLTGAASSGDVAQQLKDASRGFLAEAENLSTARRDAGRRFAERLEAELATLAMDGTRFEVRVQSSRDEHDWRASGIDSGEFYFSPNVGEDLRPLARIVSGGELSRVMLAMKTLTVGEENGGSPAGAKSLIFDEVDAGIGGRVATVVGQKLAALGNQFQVLCITHLPQIAAFGRTHFLIDKQVRLGRTSTDVVRLDGEGRVVELARMMGGAASGAHSIAGARELLAHSMAKGENRPNAKGESRPMAKAKPRARV
ncbi:MAG: DNA repair protein RecN [Vicinamibacterales bacterium]